MKTNIHASCVALGNKGVLLLGDSGAGKSDLALRLIDGGAKLVTDDRTDLSVRNGKLFARAPVILAGGCDPACGDGLGAVHFGVDGEPVDR